MSLVVLVLAVGILSHLGTNTGSFSKLELRLEQSLELEFPAEPSGCCMPLPRHRVEFIHTDPKPLLLFSIAVEDKCYKQDWFSRETDHPVFLPLTAQNY